MRTPILLTFLGLSAVACGSLPQAPGLPSVPSVPGAAALNGAVPGAPAIPGAPAAAPGAPTSAPETTSAAVPGAGSKAAAPAASAPTTVEVHSDCAKTVSVFYGEKPKFGSGTKSSISSNSTTTASRKADGTLTVWIIDDKENGLANAKVDASTKRVDIDKSCKNISAH